MTISDEDAKLRAIGAEAEALFDAGKLDRAAFDRLRAEIVAVAKEHPDAIEMLSIFAQDESWFDEPAT